MKNCLPWDTTATDGDGGTAAAAAGTQVVRRLIVVMLFTAATLDLTRCGLAVAAARHPAPTAGLVTAGLAAAALTARIARGCQAGRRWAGWAALLTGVASAPQAAASGFRTLTCFPIRPPLPWEYCWPSQSWRPRAGWTAGDTTPESSRRGHGTHAVTPNAVA